MDTLILSSQDITQAARLIQEGQLVAFPTETVYGLGASIFNPGAIASIFTAKGRPSDNPLIAHICSLDQLDLIAQDIPPVFWTLAKAFFPGPLTVVLKKHPNVPGVVSAGLETIALRMPAHPIAQALIEAVGAPLVAPSANLSGRPSGTSAAHILEDFKGKIAAVIDGGPTQYGIESTVISLLGPTPVLLRPGAISKEAIEAVLGRPIETATKHEGPVISPGMKYRHYAPQTPIRLFFNEEEFKTHCKESRTEKTMLLTKELGTLNAPEIYAKLRQADTDDCSEILIYCDPVTQRDEALMHRIYKAAQTS